MYKFRFFRRPLLSSFVVTAALFTVASSAHAEDAPAAPVAKQTKAAAPPADTKTEAAPAAEGEAAETTEEAPAAPAPPTDEEREAARLSFEAGMAAFGEEDYATAEGEFRKAYKAIPSPHAEYWIALSLDKADPEAKDAKKIAVAYETFLSNPGAGHVGAEKVAESQARLDELRKGLPATVTIVSVPEGAAVTINGEAKEGVTPLTVEIPAGTYKVGLTLEGHDDTEVELVAEGGIALEQQVTLNETPAPVVAAAPVVAPAAATEPVEKNYVPAAVTLGIGGAGLITGTIFGIMALNSKSKFNDDPTTENADAAERNALIADMSFGVALTLGITGIVLLTADDEEAPAAEETARLLRKPKSGDLVVAPYASRTGGGAAARLTF